MNFVPASVSRINQTVQSNHGKIYCKPRWYRNKRSILWGNNSPWSFSCVHMPCYKTLTNCVQDYLFKDGCRVNLENRDSISP